jgi:hypothetical protein
MSVKVKQAYIKNSTYGPGVELLENLSLYFDFANKKFYNDETGELGMLPYGSPTISTREFSVLDNHIYLPESSFLTFPLSNSGSDEGTLEFLLETDKDITSFSTVSTGVSQFAELDFVQKLFFQFTYFINPSNYTISSLINGAPVYTEVFIEKPLTLQEEPIKISSKNSGVKLSFLRYYNIALTEAQLLKNYSSMKSRL